MGAWRSDHPCFSSAMRRLGRTNTFRICYTLLMAKQNKKVRKRNEQEMDGVFVLKMVLFVILGSLWVKVTKSGASLHVPIPAGLIVGLLLSMHEHFSIDRKIEYAVLVSAALFGYIAPYGLFITL